MYYLFSSSIIIVQSHKLHFLNDYKTIIRSTVVIGLFFIQMIQCFLCVHHHTKIVLIIFCLRFFIYLYFTYWYFVVIRFIVWSDFGTITWNIALSDFFIWLKQCFQSLHHHNKNCTRNILFPLERRSDQDVHLFYVLSHLRAPRNGHTILSTNFWIMFNSE